MTEEEFEEKYKEVIDIINNTHTSLMVEDFVEDMYLKIKRQQKEIEELKKVIKIVEIYKSYGIPEDAEMVIMRKDDFLRNTNNEFISKDKIRAKIKEIENVETDKISREAYNRAEFTIEILLELLEE